MKEIMIIVPTEREAEFFAGHGLSAHICGVGMAECAAETALLITECSAGGRRPDLVILAGIAGTYTDRLGLGDTVVVASETVADLGRAGADGFVPLFQKAYSAGFVPEGFTVVHSNTVNTAGRNADGGSAGPSSKTDRGEVSVENMEGAAFFAVCERFGIPAAELRTISNRVGEAVSSEGLDLAARNLARALKQLLRSVRR